MTGYSEDPHREPKFPGREADESGNLSLTVTVAGEQIRLATVLKVAAEAGDLYETYIGLVSRETQLGLHDTSQERAVRKGEEFLLQKLRKLL